MNQILPIDFKFIFSGSFKCNHFWCFSPNNMAMLFNFEIHCLHDCHMYSTLLHNRPKNKAWTMAIEIFLILPIAAAEFSSIQSFCRFPVTQSTVPPPPSRPPFFLLLPSLHRIATFVLSQAHVGPFHAGPAAWCPLVGRARASTRFPSMRLAHGHSSVTPKASRRLSGFQTTI